MKNPKERLYLFSRALDFISYLWINLNRIFIFIESHRGIFLFFISILAFFIGWFVFAISPFQPLEEIAFKQSEYRLTEQQELIKSEMIDHHIKLGNSFLNVMQLDAASNEFEEALKLDPLNLSAKKGLFKSELFKPIVEKDYDPEIMEKKLKLVLEENPDDPQAFLFLGEIYSSVDPDLALRYYQTAIEKDPSVAAAYFGIGVIYEEHNESDDALEMYEKALSLSKWNQVFLENLGRQYYMRKEYPKAIEKYELLLRLNGYFLSAYYTSSNAYRLTGNLEQARLDQEILIRLLDDANVTSLKRNQETWFFRAGAEETVFYDIPEKKFYAYYNMALTYYLLGDETDALRYIKKARDLHIDKSKELEVMKLMNFDIDDLQEEQSTLRTRTDEFRKKFL